jgi:iron complex outermembrane receptor protein
MFCTKQLLSFGLCASMAATAATAFAQTEHPQTWAQDIAYLQQLTPADAAAQQGSILQIRSEVSLWITSHPGSKIQLAPLRALPLTAVQASAELGELQKVVAAIVEQDPSHPFHLGVTEVEVSAGLSGLSTTSPTAVSLDQEEIQAHDATNVAKAVDWLPGVEVQHLAGNRNETALYIRGFSSKGQVPIYLDGIPMYVPYDGYIDLNRFLTSDYSEIQISRGFSSPLLGPNALGGTVNLVTREPLKKFEGDLAIGTFSGNGLLSSLRVGTRQTRFLAQGTLDWLQNDYVPLSGNFLYPTYTSGGSVIEGYSALNSGNTYGNVPYPYTDHENNSYTRDEKWGGRIGWLPKQGGEYVFSYINQKGQKSDPLYQGRNSGASFNSFWKWPYWNKNSYYFLSDTPLGKQSSIKFRVYYDQFRNSIDMYDNSQYNSFTAYAPSGKSPQVKNGLCQTGYVCGLKGSEHSSYDDHTDGASTEFNTRKVKRNVIGASFFFKDDTHNAVDIYPGAAAYLAKYYGTSPYTATAQQIQLAYHNPNQELRDQQFSAGVQDLIAFSSKFHGSVGFSADHLKGLKEEYRNSFNQTTLGAIAGTELLAYQCTGNPHNTSTAGCTSHVWTYNPQASLTYTATLSDILFVTYEDRGRFPTLKERYSSGMGSSLPNPGLLTEHSQNWNFGYTHIFGPKLTFDGVLYLSKLRNAIESALVPDTYSLCPSNNSPGHCSQNINVAHETHEGVEVTLHGNPIQRLKLDMNYTYLNRELNPSTYVLSTGIPKNKAVGTATVRLPYQILGIVTAHYEGGITLQDTTYSSTTQPLLYAHNGESLATMDLATELPIAPRFSAQVGVKNVFDRNYFYTAGYPEEGRNWFINLRYRF